MNMLQFLGQMPEAAQREALAEFGVRELKDLENDWYLTARREQLPPAGDWGIWLIMAGRGFGKTRTGAERLIFKHRHSLCSSSALVGATARDVRRFMIEGPSGILACAPPDFTPEYLSTKNELVWPDGTKTLIYTAEEPERLRGPNHDFAWCDELGAWVEHSEELLEYCWQMLRLTLRIGSPETIITTTPKPRMLLHNIIARPDVVITGGSTYENSPNLAAEWLHELRIDFEGTSLGAQELHAQLLSMASGGLWNFPQLERLRIAHADKPMMVRIVIGVDPATTAAEGSDYTAIIVAGLAADGMAYVLSDHTLKASPSIWGQKVADLYKLYGANQVIAERNQGGDMVSHVLHTADKHMPVKLVHASKGKVTRAEPIAAKYEQGLVRHMPGLIDLEQQMCMMKPGRMKKSPDRADALVWALTELIGGFTSRSGAWGTRKHQNS